MIHSLIKNRTHRILLQLCIACCLLAAVILYSLYGHQLITTIYKGESLAVLNDLMIGQEQDLYLLEYYFAKADRMALQGFLFCGVFLVVLFVKEQHLAATYSAISGLGDYFHRHKSIVQGAGLLFAFSITSLIAIYILQLFPNSADEYSYRYQAKTFLAGRLWNSPHPLQEFFNSIWILHAGDKVFSMYWPGWPMVLALAELLHIPVFLVNPLLGTFSLLVFYKIGVRLYGEKIAFLATLLLFFTSFFLFNAASYFNHALCTLCILLFVYYCLRAVEKNSSGYALLAGVFIGIGFITRPFSALIAALPLSFYLLWKTRSRPMIHVSVIGGGLPFLLLLFAYNHQVTGDMLVSPATLALSSEESWGITKNNFINLVRFSLLFVSWTPPLLIAVYLCLLPELFKRTGKNVVAIIFPLLVVAHFFFTLSGGNQYGPRYYFEGFPFLILFVCSHLLQEDSYFALKPGRRFLFGLLAISILFSVPFMVLHFSYYRQVIYERTQPYRMVDEMKLDNVLVFLQSGSGIRLKPMPIEDLVRNDINYENRVLFVHDRGKENTKLMQAYPERMSYAFRYSWEQDRYLLEPYSPVLNQ